MTIHHIVHVEGLSALTDLVQMIYEKLDAMKTPERREVIDGSNQDVLKALGLDPKKARKRYKGTYTDEQSISKMVGRKVTRGEVKDAARTLNVSSFQDETNHHVYILNTNLDLVVRYLRGKK